MKSILQFMPDIIPWNDWHNLYVDLFIIGDGCSSGILEKDV